MVFVRAVATIEMMEELKKDRMVTIWDKLKGSLLAKDRSRDIFAMRESAREIPFSTRSL